MGITKLPRYVSEGLCRLENAGYEAYVVGGCVRDSLLCLEPTDFDITTSANPEEIKTVFATERTIDFGMKHGTVSVVFEEGILEITTFRLDGDYLDARHPSQVTFTRSLEEDLKRRDFTINAMAYSPKHGLVDLFGGQDDVKQKVIRCVGEPQKRFNEDALRIMRALRFASVLGFNIEPETKNAALELRHGLKRIASERIFSEFIKMLCGKHIRSVLLEMVDVIGVFVPEILDAKGFSQQNPHHLYDVLEHTAVALEQVDATPTCRLAMFFHDIGKPFVFSLDEKSVGHFHGHAKKSCEIAKNTLSFLRAENALTDFVLQLVEWHDVWIEPQKKSVKRVLARLTPEGFDALLSIKKADNLAQHPDCRNRLRVYEELKNIAEEIIAEESCFRLKDLAIDGNDLIAIGFTRGKKLGETLNYLLDGVIDERLLNEREALLTEALKMK